MKNFSPEAAEAIRKRKREIALKNLDKAREAKKLKNRERYLDTLEKDIDELMRTAEKAFDDMPKEVYNQVKKVIEHELTQKDFSKFLAHDFIKAYADMGGRETLILHVKKNPARYMQFIDALIKITKQASDGITGGGQRVQVNIMGLDPNQNVVVVAQDAK